MKQLITFCISIMLCIATSFAQSFDTTQFYGKNNYLFQHIDKTPITTGLLRDYGIDFQELNNYTGTALHDSNFTSLADWRMLYASLYSQQINSTASLMYLDTLNKLFSQYGIMGDPISFVGLYYNYQSIDPNAQDNNQFYISNNQLYDVSGRSGSPYLTNEVFSVATTRQVAATGDNQFIFRSSLLFGNTGKTISSIQVDALGTGNYQTVTIGTAFTAHYDTAGLYNINITITYADNTVKYAHTKLAVYGSNYGGASVNFHKAFGYKGYGPPYAHEVFTYGTRGNNESVQATKAYLGVFAQGDITIDLAVSNTTGQIRKPLIIIEGFDPNQEFNYNGFFDGLVPRLNRDINTNNPITLNTGLDNINEYDLIFVNYANGTDYIQRNAFLLERVIEIVNNRKTFWNGVRQQNVIVGMSMGGLVVRYALRDMELNNQNHDTRLFISHDAPHNGANVPVAYQALVQYIAPWKIVNFGGNFPFIRWVDMFPQAVDAENLFNSPAAKQMLIQRYSLQSSGSNTFNSLTYSLSADNSVHNAFMTELNNLGWPINCKNITLANGACNGTIQFADNSKMLSIDGTQSWSYFGGLWRSFVATIGGINSANISLTLGTVPINNNALAVQYPLALISTKTNLVFDFGAWAIPANGTSEIFRGDVYIKRKLLWLFNSTSYILKCHVSSTGNMLPIDNAPGGVYDLIAFGLDINDVNDQLHNSLGDWANAKVLQPQFCFVPTVSALAFSNPTSFYRSAICDIVNCNNPTAVANYFAPQTNQLHISYTQENTNWILQNQDANFNCAKICADNLSITGNSPICTSELFTLNNAPAGSTINWVLSPSNLVTPFTNGNQITLQRNGTSNGVITLTATITNGCNVTPSVSKQNIVVGTGFNIVSFTEKYITCLNSKPYFYGAVLAVPAATNYEWYSKDESNANNPFILRQSSSSNTADFPLGNNKGNRYYTIRVIATNPCGTIQTIAADGYLFAPNCTNQNGLRLATSPNPSTSTMQLELIDDSNTNTTAAETTNASTAQSTPTIQEIQIIDKAGKIKKSIKGNKKSKITINIADLPKDMYTISVFDGENWFTSNIIKN